jgi:hypothetical protein
VVRGWQPSLRTIDHFVLLFSSSIFPLEFLGLVWELHVEIFWEGRMIRRQARPCMNLHGMYRWFGVVPQGLIVSLPCSPFWWYSEPFLVEFPVAVFRPFYLEFGAECMHEPFLDLFPFDSPPKSVSKGARFWGFLFFRIRGILGGISSIPLVLASLGGLNLGYGVPMRCFYYP